MAELLPSNCLPILETSSFPRLHQRPLCNFHQFPLLENKTAWTHIKKREERSQSLQISDLEISWNLQNNQPPNSDQMCKLSAKYEDYTLTFIGNSSGIPFVFFLANDKYVYIYIILYYLYIYISLHIPTPRIFESLETGWLSPFLHRTAKLNKI